ncbi:MAG TPA: hypothetical protein VF423_01850 [Actinomycetes bacterium]
MDAMGDADELEDDEDLPQQHEAFLTPEARAFIGAGLVLTSLLGTGLFQFFSFFVINDGGDSERWRQYLSYAGPSGVLAAAGAIVGGPVLRAVTGASVRGLAAAAVVVGTVITLAVVAGLIIVTTVDSGPTF